MLIPIKAFGPIHFCLCQDLFFPLTCKTFESVVKYYHEEDFSQYASSMKTAVAIKGLFLDAKRFLDNEDPTRVAYAKKTISLLEDFLYTYGLFNETGHIVLPIGLENRAFKKQSKAIVKTFDQRIKETLIDEDSAKTNKRPSKPKGLGIKH